MEQRSGILSPNPTLRAIAKNMLICVGWQGYLENYLPQMVKLLNSQPLELAMRLKAEIAKEQEAIGPYDMSFYAQMANELMNNVFRTKDEEIE